MADWDKQFLDRYLAESDGEYPRQYGSNLQEGFEAKRVLTPEQVTLNQRRKLNQQVSNNEDEMHLQQLQSYGSTDPSVSDEEWNRRRGQPVEEQWGDLGEAIRVQQMYKRLNQR